LAKIKEGKARELSSSLLNFLLVRLRGRRSQGCVPRLLWQKDRGSDRSWEEVGAVTVLDVGKVYSVIAHLARQSGRYPEQELTELETAVRCANSDLSDDMEQLESSIRRLEQTAEGEGGDELVEALVHVRIHVMGLATAFDNMTNDLSILFERRAIRSGGFGA
jgi:hypothetical protein